MVKKSLVIILAITAIMFSSFNADDEVWGFFGHRMINKLAIFTLPPAIISFYKANLDYIEAHAIDPDKRRHSFKPEATRHYIDIDNWGIYPFHDVPRKLDSAIMQHAEIVVIGPGKDTIDISPLSSFIEEPDVISALYDSVNRHLNQLRYDESLDITSWLPKYYHERFGMPNQIYLFDRFSSFGILPYYLESFHKKLETAFHFQDFENIVRISAELGHYISDAHVPLHTTLNYNGQLSNQTGIHAFWESRLPELYAESEYDFFVGPAVYITDKRKFYWDIVLASHLLVDDVLNTERKIRANLPEDEIYCFDERNGITTRLECEQFANAYHDAMKGMVEERMRSSIISIGSAWYTAWVDAGRPPLNKKTTNVTESKDHINPVIATFKN